MSDSFGRRLRRRAVTIPAIVTGFVVVSALLPGALLLALAVDALRGTLRTRPTTRLIAFVASFLFTETVGLAQLGALWVVCLGRRAALERRTWPVQRRYVSMHLFFVRALYDLSFVVEGDELATPGPLLVLIRHSSVIDTLIPGAFLANARHRLELRYVLKKELLVDPCLDVAGHWLPNHFVSRDGADSSRESDAVRALTHGLGPSAGVLIYPEGTRFTTRKREQTLARLADDAPALERARRLTHLLPIRPGGTLALLDAAPTCDVLFVGHTGLEGFASLRDIWSGQLVGRTVRVKFWREPAASIPAARDERLAWLQAHWERVNAWVAG